MNFNEADKVVHLVETQWHFPIMDKFGFVPKTKSAVGFVRGYVYLHPSLPNEIIVSTGASADYWRDQLTGRNGYWASLGPYVKGLLFLNKELDTVTE